VRVVDTALDASRTLLSAVDLIADPIRANGNRIPQDYNLVGVLGAASAEVCEMGSTGDRRRCRCRRRRRRNCDRRSMTRL
jgi:hypothetical protein